MFKGYLIETFQCRVPLLRCLKLITKLTTICTKYVTHGFFYPTYESLLSKFRSMNMMMYVCFSSEVYRKILSKTRVVPHLNNSFFLAHHLYRHFLQKTAMNKSHFDIVMQFVLGIFSLGI